MAIDMSQEQTAALQNFQGQLSSIACTSILTPEQFEDTWEYLHHLPPMHKYFSASLEERLAAAIHYFGDMTEFAIEPDGLYDYSLKPEANAKLYPTRWYIGFTEDVPPAHPLLVDGFEKHEGDVRKALMSALYLLLWKVGCYNCNDTDVYYDDETETDEPMPEMPKFKMHRAAFDRVKEQQNELGDWLRSVEVVAKHFEFSDIRTYGEETTDADSLYPMVYKHIQAGYNQIENWRQMGWPYTPLGQYYVVDRSGLISDMPPINPERYLSKIFSFNLETLAYEFRTT